MQNCTSICEFLKSNYSTPQISKTNTVLSNNKNKKISKQHPEINVVKIDKPNRIVLMIKTHYENKILNLIELKNTDSKSKIYLTQKTPKENT